MMIPGDLTRYIQSPDVSINRPFKEEIRRNSMSIVSKLKIYRFCLKLIIDRVGRYGTVRN